jgi:hypothetical protein
MAAASNSGLAAAAVTCSRKQHRFAAPRADAALASLAPPCFYFGACGQRAELEKLGRTVCRRCASHLRGDEYPLQIQEQPAPATEPKPAEAHRPPRRHRARLPRPADPAEVEHRRQLRLARRRDRQQAQRLAADPIEKESQRQARRAWQQAYRERNREQLREKERLRHARAKLQRQSQAIL